MADCSEKCKELVLVSLESDKDENLGSCSEELIDPLSLSSGIHEEEDVVGCRSGCNETSNGDPLPVEPFVIIKTEPEDSESLESKCDEDSEDEVKYSCVMTSEYNILGSEKKQLIDSECEKSISHKKSKKRIRNPARNQLCENCGKTFPNRSQLRNHMRTHTGEKPFVCTECGIGFSQKGCLTVHMNSHAGLKRFKCDECGKAFSRKMNYKSHMLTHTGEAPFRCDVCGRVFYLGSKLSAHLRIHSGERRFECSLCNKAYIYNIDLVRHMRTHTGEKPFECKDCGKAFTTKSNLSRHLLKMHMG